MCVCVCMCVHACVCVCACMCVYVCDVTSTYMCPQLQSSVSEEEGMNGTAVEGEVDHEWAPSAVVQRLSGEDGVDEKPQQCTTAVNSMYYVSVET